METKIKLPEHIKQWYLLQSKIHRIPLQNIIDYALSKRIIPSGFVGTVLFDFSTMVSKLSIRTVLEEDEATIYLFGFYFNQNPAFTVMSLN